MPAVAHRPRDHGRGERGLEAEGRRDRADRLPDQHAVVRRADGVGRRDRDLKLARGVLRVELLDRDALLLQRLHDLPAVVRQLDHAGHAVPVLLGADGPLHLEAHPQLQAPLASLAGQAAGERALAPGVDPALLRVAVDRGPGPPALPSKHGQPVGVRDQTQVATRAGDVLARGDLVVDDEHVEHRRHADPPAGRALQAAQRDGLHAGDAGVVDPAQRHHGDARRAEPPGRRARLADSLGPLAGSQDHRPDARRAFGLRLPARSRGAASPGGATSRRSHPAPRRSPRRPPPLRSPGPGSRRPSRRVCGTLQRRPK